MSFARRALPLVVASALSACGGEGTPPSAGTPSAGTPSAGTSVRTLTLGAYTTPREAYGEILPAFAARWKQDHGEDVKVEESYQGSGAQARAIVDGFEADVAALSLDPDLVTVQKAGLVTSDWHALPHQGVVTDSIVVLAVRPGNPKGVHDWADLARDDVEVLTPNVRTSGGAMWNVAAVYGAALRGHAGVPANDPEAATKVLHDVLARVVVMDKGARESMQSFDKGIGDVAITYENEVIAAKQAGEAIDYVVPSSTILIENPVAVVDGYAAKHGSEDVARGFVDFLFTPDAQRVFGKHGFRPVDDTVAAETPLPKPDDLFTIRDLGGWDGAKATLFADGAVYDQALEGVGTR